MGVLKDVLKTWVLNDDYEVVARSDSKGSIKDFSEIYSKDTPSSKSVLGMKPEDFDKELVEDIIENEPLVKSAVISIVDKVFEGGFQLRAKNEKSGLSSFEEVAKKEQLELVLRQVVANLVIYNNAFLEVLTDEDDKLANFNLLESLYTEPQVETNGDVIGYIQSIANAQPVTWDAEEVVHFKLDNINTYPYAKNSLKPIWSVLILKDSIRHYLKWFYKTRQNRPILEFDENAKEDAILKILGLLKNASTYLEKPLVSRGKIESKMYNDNTSHEMLLKLLDWCDEQILMLLQVPPVIVGKNNESGRNESAELRNVFYTRVRSIQRILELYMNGDFFDKAGYSNVEIKFNALDSQSTKTALELVSYMRKSQFTAEAVEEALEQFGLNFTVDKVFKTDEEIAAMSNADLGTGNEALKGNADKDDMDSRRRKGTGSNEVQE